MLEEIYDEIDNLPEPTPYTPAPQRDDLDPNSVTARAIAYLRDCEPSIQGSGGSGKLMWAARAVCWGFDLGAATGLDLLHVHFNPRCQPAWSDGELARACDRAMQDSERPRGWLMNESRPMPARSTAATGATPATAPAGQAKGKGAATVADDILAAVGGAPAETTPAAAESTAPTDTADAVVGEFASTIGLDDDDPSKLADAFMAQFSTPEGATLRYWREDYHLYANGASSRIGEADMRARMVQFVEGEISRSHQRKVAHWLAASEKGGTTAKQPRRRHVTTSLIGHFIQAVKTRAITSSERTPPFWDSDPGPPPSELIAMRNGLVHLPTIADGIGDPFIPATPRYFNLNACDYDYAPLKTSAASRPAQWLAFLHSLWPGDAASIAALQEWFGYLLTPDTSMQKMLLVIGPPRAGKGTIGKVLRRLIGEANIAAPKLSFIADRFGLQDLIGKTVAMIGDARLSGRADSVAVTETLLGISGEDPQTIDRKNREPVTLKLNTRFVLFSNELPRLGDSSGAIVSRLVVLRLVKSFLGEEDDTLGDKLCTELPGIFHWACDGWKRLRQQRRFTQPESAAELIREASDIASPVKRFIEERCCTDDPNERTEAKPLYKAWSDWCKDHGYVCSSDAVFGRDLRAAFPKVQKQRLRESGVGSRKSVYVGVRLLTAVEAGDYGE